MSLPQHIRDKVMSQEFIEALERFRREGRGKLSAVDKNFIQFLSATLQMPEDEARKYAGGVVVLVGKILQSGRVRATRRVGADVGGKFIHSNTLATTLFFLFSLVTPDASKRMYSLLESDVVRALSGESAGVIYFQPITPSNYVAVINKFKEVLAAHRELCRVRDYFGILCAKSSFMYVERTQGKTSPVDACLDMLASIESEVCGSERLP